MAATINHPQTAPVDLGALLDARVGAVVTLVAGHTRLVAHRAVLAAGSTVFAAEFPHNTLDTSISEVTISDVEGPVLRQLIVFLYTGKAPQLPEMAPHLLAAAEKYGVAALKAVCEQQLAEQLTVENAAATAILAVRHSCHSLRKAAVSFIKAHNHEVVPTQGWADVVLHHPAHIFKVSRLLAEPPAETSARTTADSSTDPTDAHTSGDSSGDSTATLTITDSSAIPTNATTTTDNSAGHIAGATATTADSSAIPTNATTTTDNSAGHTADTTATTADSSVVPSNAATTTTTTTTDNSAGHTAGTTATTADSSVVPANTTTADNSAGHTAGTTATTADSNAPLTAADSSAAPNTTSQSTVPDAAAFSHLRSLSPDERNRRLWEAARDGAVDEVRALLTLGADVGAVDEDEWTALHYAAFNGEAAVVRLLLAAAADPNARNGMGWPPLHLAALWGEAEATAALLEGGADRWAQDELGITALDLAREDGYAEVEQLLL